MKDQPRSDGRTARGTFAKGTSGNIKGVPAEPQPRMDGWGSALSGIGTTEFDKRTSHTFVAPTITHEQAVELWRGDDLASSAIEKVPIECFREGYEVTIADEGDYDNLKTEISNKLRDLQVDKKLKQALCIERALGGSAVLLGTNDNRAMNQPLDPARVTKIKWLNVLEPCEIEPASYYDDPLSDKYGEVEFYQLTGQRPATTYTKIPKSRKKLFDFNKVIHESRLIVFGGIKVSRYQLSTGTSGVNWGDSILVRMIEILRDFNVAMHAAGIIVTDFSQAVFKIDNLMSLVSRSPEALRDRMRALEMGRSVARAVLIDTKESFERQTTQTSGLPEMLTQLSKRLAAAIGVPLELLMNDIAAGEHTNVARFFYDYVHGYQNETVAPPLRLIIKMIIQGLRQRKAPKRWDIRFRPLWRLTDQQQAEARLAQARVDSIYIKMGVLSADEVRKARFSGEYSYETPVPEGTKAPGFVTLPPKGVGPEGAAALGVSPDGKPLGVGATAHAVSPYTRSNPTTSGDNNAATSTGDGGGDSAPEDNRDHAGESDDEPAG